MKLGLIVNPMAGLGGPAGLKGSDGSETVKQALLRGSRSQVADRVSTTLRALDAVRDEIDIVTVAGSMGGEICLSLGWPARMIDVEVPVNSSAEHTRMVAQHLQTLNIDLLVFAGGDGTARDICDVVTGNQAVMGLPCGVKMHSGVFANNPVSAARVIEEMARGQLVTVASGEVRDIDESSFREGILRTRYYGELWVPEELRYMQQVKSGGREVEELVVEEIAADIAEQMKDDVTYFIGSGSTTARIMNRLELANTLLGVDVVRNGELLQADAYEKQLFEYAQKESCRVVITVIGGQGHILGRGNQQFSPRVLNAVGLGNIIVVASKSKLEALERTLVVDTGDSELDLSLSGFIRVITGFEDAVLCPVRC